MNTNAHNMLQCAGGWSAAGATDEAEALEDTADEGAAAGASRAVGDAAIAAAMAACASCSAVGSPFGTSPWPSSATGSSCASSLEQAVAASRQARTAAAIRMVFMEMGLSTKTKGLRDRRAALRQTIARTGE